MTTLTFYEKKDKSYIKYWTFAIVYGILIYPDWRFYMQVYTINSDYPFGSNMYLIFSGDECAVIDPSASYETVKKVLPIKNFKIKYILITHAHFDHILYLDNWCDKTGITPSISSNDAVLIKDSKLNCYLNFLGIDKAYLKELNIINAADKLALGSDIIEVISVPGHTEGSLAFITKDSVFVGDTVFANGGIGRTDLPSGNYSKLISSIEKIKALDKSLKVYPGHGYTTSVSKI